MKTKKPNTTIYRDKLVTLHQGDAINLMKSLSSDSFQAVITDPPYSSGGMARSDRTNNRATSKYVLNGTKKIYPEFFGDNRDQRGFIYWCTLWLAECWRVTRPGGYLFVFTDWRQLPAMTDAIQAGGWVWRGIVPWDKTESSKPQKGWFRHQCEYVLCGSKGSMGAEQARSVEVYAPGIFRQRSNPAEKFHATGKPVDLMKFLMQLLPPSSTVLDPFAGSGTTLLAARALGHRSVGMELSRELCDVISDRLSA